MQLTDFRVIKLNQNGKDLFVGTLSGRQLVELPLQVDSWDAWMGYQRQKLVRKANKIKDFLLSNNGLMPTSILASFRSARVRFRPTSGAYGILTVPDSARTYIVDGQHRVEGLKRAIQEKRELQDFVYPVVFMAPSKWGRRYQPEMEEGKQFITINKTQTKVPTDLVDTMLWSLRFYDQQDSQVAKESLPEEIYEEMKIRAKALTLVNQIRDYENWRGKIRFANAPKGDTILKQSVMVDTLVNEIMSKSPYDAMTVEELAIRLDNYWSAILDYYPNARTSPSQYFIQRRFGIYVFHTVFPTIDRATSGPHDVGDFAAALARFSMKDDDFWGPDGDASELGTSFKNVGRVSRAIARRRTT